MKEDTIKAMKASAVHWTENMVADFKKVSIAQAACSLCDVFAVWSVKAERYECEGCPVKDATGLHHCAGSPYEEVADAYDGWACLKRNAEPGRDDKIVTDAEDAFRTGAERERDFLISLLPEKERDSALKACGKITA